jgi:hypothetical protein
MIRTFARLRAHGHHPRLLATLAVASATVVAACGTSGGPSAGPYGSTPSSAPRAHAMAGWKDGAGKTPTMRTWLSERFGLRSGG